MVVTLLHHLNQCPQFCEENKHTMDAKDIAIESTVNAMYIKLNICKLQW